MIARNKQKYGNVTPVTFPNILVNYTEQISFNETERPVNAHWWRTVNIYWTYWRFNTASVLDRWD